MVFFIDLSLKQYIFICGVCYFTFSKNDLPYIAFGMGRGFGRVVAILQTGKDRISDFISTQATDHVMHADSSNPSGSGSTAKKSDIHSNREEIAKKLGEFQQIRDELRSMSAMSTMGIFPTSFDGAVNKFVSQNIKKDDAVVGENKMSISPPDVAMAAGFSNPASQVFRNEPSTIALQNVTSSSNGVPRNDRNVQSFSENNPQPSNNMASSTSQQRIATPKAATNNATTKILPSFIQIKNNRTIPTNGSESLIEGLDELRMVNEFNKLQKGMR